MREYKENRCFQNTSKYFSEYTMMADIHGVRHLTWRTSFERIFWAFIIIILLLNCIAFFIRLYIKFLQAPLVLNYKNEEGSIQDIPFPAITICPETKTKRNLFNYRQTKLKILNRENLTEFEEKAFHYIHLLCRHDTDHIHKLWDFKDKYLGDDFYQIVEELSPTIEDIMVECIWMRTVINCSKIFTKIITEEGVCYTFNILDKHHIFKNQVYFYKSYFNSENKLNDWDVERGYGKSSKTATYPARTLYSGPKHGLSVVLKLNRSNFDSECKYALHGFKLVFDQPANIPRGELHYFRMSPSGAFIAIIKPDHISISESLKKYHPVSRNCFLTSERSLKYFKSYLQTNCYLECLSNYTLLRCECVAYYMPRSKDIPVCSAYHQKCVHDAEDELEMMEIGLKIKNNETYYKPSFCNCLPSCASLGYNVEISTSRWNSQKYLKHRGINVDLNNDTTYSKLSVHYKANFFLQYERDIMFSFLDLMAKCGGLFSLLTGMSIISLIEIMYFLSFRLFCNKRMYGNWTGPDPEKIPSVISLLNKMVVIVSVKVFRRVRFFYIKDLPKKLNQMAEDKTDGDLQKHYFKEQLKRHLYDLEKEAAIYEEKEKKHKDMYVGSKECGSKLRQYLRDYSLSTTIPGCFYVGENRSVCEKVFWIIIVLASMMACIYMIHDAYKNFQEKSVIISIDTEITSSYNHYFPAVTICSLSQWIKEVFNIDEYLKIKKANQSIPEEMNKHYHYFYALCEHKIENFGEMKIYTDDFYATLMKVSPPFNELFFRCEVFGKSQNCSDLFYPTITEDGICYTFNMVSREHLFKDKIYYYKNLFKTKPNKGWSQEKGYDKNAGLNTYPQRALQTGIEGAVRVTLRLKKSVYDFSCSSYLEGFKVFIHNPTVFPRTSKTHFYISTGEYVAVSTEASLLTIDPEVEMLSQKKRKCYLHNEKHLDYFKIYSQSNCMLECLTKHALSKCKCVSFNMPRTKSTPVCGPAKYVCTIEAEDDINSMKQEIRNKKCGCFPLCTHFALSVETFRNTWNATQYYQNHEEIEFGGLGKTNFSADEMTLLSIYMKTDSARALKRQELLGIASLISKFGGFLNVCTGLSFISILEVLYFLTLRIFCNSRLYKSWSGP